MFANDGESWELPKKEEVGVAATLDCYVHCRQTVFNIYCTFILEE